jgi:uncharacterized membrane protein YccC
MKEPVITRLERAAFAIVCGLLLFYSALLDPDPTLPTWASVAIGLLASGCLAWFIWHTSSDRDRIG